MIKFNSPVSWFEKSGLALFCCQLLNFFFCLPFFHIGTSIQVEPTILAIFAIGVFTCIWLVIGIIKKWLVVELPIHPLVLLLCAWAIWQIITSLVAENQFMAWLGPPQIGEGGAFHVVLVLSVFLAMPLWANDRCRKILVAISTASLCVMAFLHFDIRMIHDPMKGTPQEYSFYYAHNPMAPFNWPDYLAFIASWVWISYAASASLRNGFRNIAGIIIFLCVLFISGNGSAYFTVLPTIIVTAIIVWVGSIKKTPPFFSKCINSYRIWKILAVFGIILPLSWIVISMYYNLAETAYIYEKSDEHIKNCKDEYKILCERIDITERAGLNQIVIEAIKDNPSSLLFGGGWGNFPNDLFKYGMLDGIRTYKNGELDPNLPSIINFNGHRYDFHSHNQPLTALHSLGIIGFLLFVAIPIVAIIYLEKSLFWWCVPVLVGVNALGNFWFFVPQTIAFQALALAALCSGRKKLDRPATLQISKYFVFFPAIMSIILAISVIEQGKAIIYGVMFYPLKFSKDPPPPPTTNEWIELDIARGGTRLNFYTISYLETLTKKINDGSITTNDREWYRKFLAISREMGIAHNANAFMRLLEPKLSMALLFEFKTPSLLDSLKPEVEKTIFASILRITESAPQREDFIAPFLLNLNKFTKGDIGKQREILENILKIAPKHRSALWLLGELYEKIPDMTEKGLAMKAQSKALGVERVFPVKF